MTNDVTQTDGITHHLNRMYQDWFLDYASYVILERAVPHIGDGFKPVQRRIMHSMKRMDDGRYNKVANIVGHTMQFHQEPVLVRSSIPTAMPASRMRWCSWGRRICWWIARATGVTSSQETMLLQADTSRPA